MKVALVIGRCPKCPWYSEMRGCMHNEGPAGIVENDYIVNPNCPLPDYVDEDEELKHIAKRELWDTIQAIRKITGDDGTHGDPSVLVQKLKDKAEYSEQMQKERDELVKVVEQAEKWFLEYAEGHQVKGDMEKYERNLKRANYLYEALSRIKGEI